MFYYFYALKKFTYSEFLDTRMHVVCAFNFIINTFLDCQYISYFSQNIFYSSKIHIPFLDFYVIFLDCKLRRGCGAVKYCFHEKSNFFKAKNPQLQGCHFIICRYPRPFQVSQILRPSQGPNEDHIDPTNLQDHVSCRSVAKRDAGIGC